MKKLLLILSLFFYINGYSQFIINSYQFGVSYDADAEAYFTRFATAGGTLSDAEKLAISTCITTLKSNSLYTGIVETGFVHGGTAATNALGFKNVHNLTFSGGGWTHVATGSTGNGTASYAQTGIVPSSELSLNDVALTIGLLSEGTIGGDNIGANQGTNQIFRLYVKATASTDGYVDIGSSSQRITSTITARIGIHTASRTTSTRVDRYQDAVSKGSSTGTQSGARPTIELYLSALNSSGTAANFTDQKIGFWCVSTSRSSAQESTFVTAIQTMLTALGK